MDLKYFYCVHPLSSSNDFEDVINNGFRDTLSNVGGDIGLPSNPTIEEVLNDDDVDEYLSSFIVFGLFARSMNGLEFILLNVHGVVVADGRNTNLKDCIYACPLGDDIVGVSILNSLTLLEVPLGWCFFLHCWPHRNVIYDEISLWNHEHCHKQIQNAWLESKCPQKGLHKYDSRHAPPAMTECC